MLSMAVSASLMLKYEIKKHILDLISVAYFRYMFVQWFQKGMQPIGRNVFIISANSLSRTKQGLFAQRKNYGAFRPFNVKLSKVTRFDGKTFGRTGCVSFFSISVLSYQYLHSYTRDRHRNTGRSPCKVLLIFDQF